jgi:hypothetical protein
MATGAALLAASLLLRYALPGPAELRPELRLEPLQKPTQATPFQTTVHGVSYTVKPIADYEIWGLVVSNHDTTTWWNWIHEASNDHLNVLDLCVVFAENVIGGGYVGLDYSSGQFVCYVQDAFSRNTRAQLKQVFDALRDLMTPPEPPKRRIGFITPEDKGKKACTK